MAKKGFSFIDDSVEEAKVVAKRLLSKDKKKKSSRKKSRK